MNITVFLGPSLPLEEARRLVPGAVFRPPAAQGDLLSALDQDEPEVLALIDGTFHQNLSVWHNEVCYVLNRGIAVYGASSMGALRAVETERYGMVGVGSIYRWYRDGAITGDDEVALLHGDASVGFRPLSVPLVNVRASVARAVAEDILDREHADRLVRIAQSLYYPERLVPLILQGCREAGFPPEPLAGAEQALTAGYVDLKRADAVELLELMARLGNGSVRPAQPPPFEFTRSAVFDTLYNLDRQVRVDDRSVSLQEVMEHAALYCAELPQIRRAALNRALVVFLGLLLEVEPTEEEVAEERERFLAEQGLTTPEALAGWMRRNAYCEPDLLEYLTEEAVCRRLRRSALTTRSFDRGAKATLDELRFTGRFPHWAAEAAEAAAIVAAYGQQLDYRGVEAEDPAVLAERHAAAGHTRITGDARVWAEDAGFDGVEGLAVALQQATIVNDVRARMARQVEALERAANAHLTPGDESSSEHM